MQSSNYMYRGTILEKPRLSNTRRGSTDLGCLGCLFSAIGVPVCAVAGTYIGEGFGWLVGNIMDVIPLVNKVAPWAAERSGLTPWVNDVSNINEDLYQAAGAAS